MHKKVEEIVKYFADKNTFAMELAFRDALVHGLGFLTVDREGNVVYTDYKEALKLAQDVKTFDETKSD